MTEYVIWGKVKKDDEHEQILFTKAKDKANAEEWCRYFEAKGMAFDTRIQVLDLSSKDFGFNSPKILNI